MEEKYLAAEKILKKYGQEHLLSQYDKLNDEKKAKLLDEILTLDFNQINELFKRIGKTEDEKNGEIEPVGCTDKSAMSKEELEHYESIGLKAIKEGNGLNFSYVPCDKFIKEQNSYAYKKNITCFDLPKEISNANFNDLYRDDSKRVPIIKYFKEFIDTYTKNKTGKGLYLSGSFGSGKTYLIAALFNELAKKDISSALVYYPELLRSLKSSFGSDYEEKFEFIKTVPLLLLDDIGAENTTAWSRDEVLGPILQYRMEEELPTFFTSNLTLKELESALSMTSNGIEKVKAKRIVERIKQLTVSLELISKNRRN